MGRVDPVQAPRKAKISWSAALKDIASVEPVEGKRSQLQIDTADGESKRFIVAHRRLSSAWSKKNAPTRDKAVKSIKAALG